MKDFLILILKGAGMGAANVIPGVSGGTVALITGIFEKLINSIKSFDLKAMKLLLSGKFKEFAEYINLTFLIAVFLGIGISIITFAQVLDFLFTNYPILIWSFFFGLILSSVYFVSKTISKWNFGVIAIFILGATIAVTISMMKPATENDAIWYLIICGIIAAASMILPGLSGSFVLILMGNYQLIMITAVKELNLMILLPVVVGAGIGLIGFSHFLSWIFNKYKDLTIAILSGFILGSLTILWPWKDEIKQTFGTGEHIKEKVIGYNWHLPTFNMEFIFAIALMIIGYISIWLMEKYANKISK